MGEQNILNNQEVITELKNLNGIKIDIIGSWVWVNGDTYNHREKLKDLGFFYSGNKKAWYYNGTKIKFKRYISKYKTYNDLKNAYNGSLIIA